MNYRPDFDLDVKVDKDFDLYSDTDIDFDSDVSVNIEKCIDIDMNLCDLQGNGATLALDVQAIGDNSLVEVISSVLVTDSYSSITLEVGAFVN